MHRLIGSSGEGGGFRLIERLISDWPSPEQLLVRVREKRALGEAIRAALAGLSPREKLIIERRYLDGARHTLAAIGRELGVSRHRVRQLEARALTKLRALLEPLLRSWQPA